MKFLKFFSFMTTNPQVSVITPTMKSRTSFIELMLLNLSCQTYPHAQMEWVVVGDSDETTESVFVEAFQKIPTIACRYFACDIVGDIGKKRNFACSLSKHKILASMDDDDVYHKEYLKYSVSEMNKRGVNMVGCRDMLVFFPLFEGKMTCVRGSLVHEATIVCRKQHWKKSKYSENCMQGEGSSMVVGSYFNELDITRVMVCMAHSANTYDKSKLLQSTEVVIPEETRKRLLRLYKELC